MSKDIFNFSTLYEKSELSDPYKNTLQEMCKYMNVNIDSINNLTNIYFHKVSKANNQ